MGRGSLLSATPRARYRLKIELSLGTAVARPSLDRGYSMMRPQPSRPGLVIAGLAAVAGQ